MSVPSIPPPKPQLPPNWQAQQANAPAGSLPGNPGLVLGILSIVCGLMGFVPLIGIVTCVLGVVAGIMGLNRARGAASQAGTITSVIGLVLSAFTVLMWIIGMLFLGGFLAILGSVVGGAAMMK
ncbi:hypothetical protein ACQW02_22190 [Humitalea sp. 24SJ18S-53]|uniref:hypothetical protein n=1 Tax=Humitalea sp. 24SJ18S-53 TaxID=3422307 RepID=UPI003D665537